MTDENALANYQSTKETAWQSVRDALLKYREAFGADQTRLLLLHMILECAELKEK